MVRRRTVFKIIGVLVLGWTFVRPDLLVVHTVVEEPLVEASATGDAAAFPVKPLTEGPFRKGTSDTRGTATVYERPDGRRFLRLSEFSTANGPDIQVYLLPVDSDRISDAVKKWNYLPLGLLKGNRGNQNYELPENVDLNAYRSVSLWCRSFNLNVGYATLIKVDGNEAAQFASSQ